MCLQVCERVIITYLDGNVNKEPEKINMKEKSRQVGKMELKELCHLVSYFPSSLAFVLI